MFERLAKFRGFALRPSTPLREVVRFHPVHANDNRPGLRRPARRDLNQRQVLACHWLPSPDGRHLECRWALASADDESASLDDGRSPCVADPPLVRSSRRMVASVMRAASGHVAS